MNYCQNSRLFKTYRAIFFFFYPFDRPLVHLSDKIPQIIPPSSSDPDIRRTHRLSDHIDGQRDSISYPILYQTISFCLAVHQGYSTPITVSQNHITFPWPCIRRMSGYTTCSPMYQGIILLILTVRAELFHLSGRIAGYSTCPTVCRDYTPLSDQSVTYFPWPTYIAYISILSLSQQPIIHKTRIPFSWINSKYFPVSLPLCVSSPPPLPTATPRIKREILMLLARRVSILRCTLGGARVALVSNENRSIFISRKEQSRLP